MVDSPEFTIAETDPGGPPVADTGMTVVKNNPSAARASAKKSALNFRTENSLSANVEIKPCRDTKTPVSSEDLQCPLQSNILHF